MLTVGFEPAIPQSGRLQMHVLDRAATGIGAISFTTYKVLRLLPFPITILLSVLLMNIAMEIQFIFFVCSILYRSYIYFCSISYLHLRNNLQV